MHIPKSRRVLIIVQCVVMHAQKLVSLTKAIPCPIVLAIDILGTVNSNAKEEMNAERVPTARRYASIAACEFFISTNS